MTARRVRCGVCQNTIPDEARVTHCLAEKQTAAQPGLQDRVQPARYGALAPVAERPSYGRTDY